MCIVEVDYHPSMSELLAVPMKPSEAVHMHREALRHLCQRYGFDRPCGLGSVLSSTDTGDSDLDLLVESRLGTTLFTLAGL